LEIPEFSLKYYIRNFKYKIPLVKCLLISVPKIIRQTRYS